MAQQKTVSFQNSSPVGATVLSSLRALVSAAALLSCVPQAEAATTYSITRMVQYAADNVTPTGALRFPAGINQLGQVVGGCSNCSVFDPATGSVININGVTEGSTWRLAYGINSAGQVAGAGGVVGGLAVRNPDGTIIHLGVLPGGLSGYAKAITDNGLVAGTSFFGTGWCAQQAVIGSVNGGPLQSLGALRANGWSHPYGMNANGQVVGVAGTPLASACDSGVRFHAFVSTPAGMKDLHPASMPQTTFGGSAAYAINNNGLAAGSVAVGGTIFAPVYRAVVWNTLTDSFVDLSTGTLSSALFGINASGQVVGQEGSYAAVGHADGGPLVDLNTLIPGKPADWHLRTAVAINDAGQIAAHDGQVGYLLTPLDSPAVVTAAPSNLTAVATSSSQIRLSWTDNATNETGQIIQRCNAVGCNPPITVGANVTSYTDNGLAAGFAYTYTVRAQGPGGDSALSNSATATTPAVALNTVPAAPGNLASGAVARTQVVLNWTDNANNETGFLLERCRGTGCTAFSQIASTGANVTTYSDSGLRAGSAYSYRLRATNAIGKSSYSNTLSVKTLP